MSEINIDLYFSMVVDVVVYIFCFLPSMLNSENKVKIQTAADICFKLLKYVVL